MTTPATSPSPRGSNRAATANASAPGRQSDGHGRRLTAAFEALEAFPALTESRNRLLRVVRDHEAPRDELVRAIESDVALSIAVLRLANRGPAAGRVASVPLAIGSLPSTAVEELAERAATYDFFERTPVWDLAPERFRLHATATQRAADRIARELDHPDRDELLAAALLHDIGKLVLVHAYDGYPARVHGDAQTPEERAHAERLTLGVDHGVVGGVLARRWGLPDRLARVIERHHVAGAEGDAAIVRLADMAAHYGHGHAVDPGEILEASRAAGLSTAGVRAILYDLPLNEAKRRRISEPSPLSGREREILRGLADGKVYKQIARDLGISVSTVRTHLHNVYGKLGAVDRAQAVLRATERGWI